MKTKRVALCLQEEFKIARTSPAEAISLLLEEIHDDLGDSLVETASVAHSIVTLNRHFYIVVVTVLAEVKADYENEEFYETYTSS